MSLPPALQGAEVPRSWEPMQGKKGVKRYMSDELRAALRAREGAFDRRERALSGILQARPPPALACRPRLLACSLVAPLYLLFCRLVLVINRPPSQGVAAFSMSPANPPCDHAPPPINRLPPQGLMAQFAERKEVWAAAVDCCAQLDALMSLAVAAACSGGPMTRPRLVPWREGGAPGRPATLLLLLPASALLSAKPRPKPCAPLHLLLLAASRGPDAPAGPLLLPSACTPPCIAARLSYVRRLSNSLGTLTISLQIMICPCAPPARPPADAGSPVFRARGLLHPAGLGGGGGVVVPNDITLGGEAKPFVVLTGGPALLPPRQLSSILRTWFPGVSELAESSGLGARRRHAACSQAATCSEKHMLWAGGPGCSCRHGATPLQPCVCTAGRMQQRGVPIFRALFPCAPPLRPLLAGPNMGGKSTLLRQVCLACLLAQVGGLWTPHTPGLSIFQL